MNKKFKLNGVNVELSKEQLQEMLDEYDKHVLEIKYDGLGDISLFKGGENLTSLLAGEEEIKYFNLSTISRDMACAMGDLMETKDVLDEDKNGYYIFYHASSHIWDWNTASSYVSDKHFKTQEIAMSVAKLLNDSKDMKDWIKRVEK